jgi:hypothetical protein
VVAGAHPAVAGVDGVGGGACGDGVAVLGDKKKEKDFATKSAEEEHSGHGDRVARTRTTKKLAQRVDLNYFKRPTAFKRARLWLSLLVPLLAVGWIVWRGFTRDSRVYSSGRMSEAHAVLEQQCASCHVAKAGGFSSIAADGACQACHDGPVHHENQVATAVPNCATCHSEHRGRIDLVAASNQSCAKCHGNLKVARGQAHYAAKIESFENGHPEFAALRDGAKDASMLQLNHAIHMKPIRQGPNGPIVQLLCSDCHRNYEAQWKYAVLPLPGPAKYRVEADFLDKKSIPGLEAGLKPSAPGSGRERMQPVEFAKACSGCHLLTFDKRFAEGVPHDTPEVMHEFLVKKFQEYIGAHPGELRVEREPQRDLAGKPLPPEMRVVTPTQWVAARTADAEELLWRKTCKQCHTLSLRGGGSLPSVEPAAIRSEWLPHAKFDHDAHRGFSCTGCHAKALTSTETSDVLVPGIANCKTCHAPGPEHSESRCFECHTYHDWAKRKEVQARFTMPGLKSGGR